jgi:hypothetical protein
MPLACTVQAEKFFAFFHLHLFGTSFRRKDLCQLIAHAEPLIDVGSQSQSEEQRSTEVTSSRAVQEARFDDFGAKISF